MTLIYHRDEQFFPHNNYGPLVAGLYSQRCNQNDSQIMKWPSKFYSVSGGTGETELTLHRIPLMHNAFFLLIFCAERLQHFSQEEKWYFQALTRRLIWAACGETQQKMFVWPLVIQNSEWLWQTPVLPPSQVFQLKNYDCGFCAFNITQVDMFWYLMMITFNFSQYCGQPWASDYHFLEDSSTRVAEEQQLSLFYAWLVRRLLKPDELIFHEGRLPITE